jgi:peptide deformylase
MRATRVRARAVDPTGAPFVRDLEDMHAVCLQHEVDHLDGTLFIDRLSPLHRLRMRWREVRGRRTAASRDGDRITA